MFLQQKTKVYEKFTLSSVPVYAQEFYHDKFVFDNL